MLTFSDTVRPTDLVTIITIGSNALKVINMISGKGIPGADIFFLCNDDSLQSFQRGPATGIHPDEPRLEQISIEKLSEMKDDIKALDSSIHLAETGSTLSEAIKPITRVVIILTSLLDERETSIVLKISRFYRERILLTVVIAGISGSAAKEQIRNSEETLMQENDMVMYFDWGHICSKAGEKWNAITRDPAIFFEMIAIRVFTEILTVKGYICMDYEDYREAIQESGMAAMGIGMAGGHGRSLAATREALGSFLFKEADPGLAHECFIFFFWGNEEITMDEVTDSLDIIDKTIRPLGGFLQGFGFEPALKDQIMVAIIVLDVTCRNTGTRKRDKNKNPTITFFTL